MDSPQPKKRNDKCDESNSDTTEDKTIFDNFELELYDLENIDKDVYKPTDTLDDENKVNKLESIETNQSSQLKKRNDRCDESISDTTEGKTFFDNFELELLHDLKNIDKDVYELTDTLDDENKVNNLESIETNQSPQPKKRNDKCDELNSNKTEDKTVFDNFELELYDLKNIDKDVYELTDTPDDENKENNLESSKTNLNLDLFEKWTVKFFPTLKKDFLKLPNYSEDDNISNEATYARLMIILIFITVVLCFITFGQLIWISFLSRGPIVVQPFIPKINNPFCK
jgi:hypothetical protein